LLIKEYDLSLAHHKPLALVHLDLYRLKSTREIKNLGVLDYFGNPKKICVIEWAERAKPLLEKFKQLKWVSFEYIDRNVRIIRIK